MPDVMSYVQGTDFTMADGFAWYHHADDDDFGALLKRCRVVLGVVEDFYDALLSLPGDDSRPQRTAQVQEWLQRVRAVRDAHSAESGEQVVSPEGILLSSGIRRPLELPCYQGRFYVAIFTDGAFHDVHYGVCAEVAALYALPVTPLVVPVAQEPGSVQRVEARAQWKQIAEDGWLLACVFLPAQRTWVSQNNAFRDTESLWGKPTLTRAQHWRVRMANAALDAWLEVLEALKGSWVCMVPEGGDYLEQMVPAFRTLCSQPEVLCRDLRIVAEMPPVDIRCKCFFKDLPSFDYNCRVAQEDAYLRGHQPAIKGPTTLRPARGGVSEAITRTLWHTMCQRVVELKAGGVFKAPAPCAALDVVVKRMDEHE